MKKLAIVLIVLVVLCFGGLFAFRVHNMLQSNLQVTGCEVYVYCPAENEAWLAQFEKDKISFERNALIGTQFQQGTLGEPSEYEYWQYSMTVKNNSFIDAEMVEVQIAGENADVFYFGETGKVDVPAREERNIWFILLTDKNGASRNNTVRNIYLTYYMQGNPKEVKYTHDSKK